MRICLLTGGGYPYRRDALGGWCRSLVEGLRHVTFDLLTVVDREPPATTAYPLPFNVASARAVLVSPADPRRRDGADQRATAAAELVCRGMLGNPGGGAETGEADPQADRVFAAGLRQLAMRPEAPLSTAALGDLLRDAGRDTESRLGPRDARTAAALLRHALRLLTVPLPEVDLVHCVGGTTPLLTGLAGRWRDDRPLLLTEARPPVTGTRPAEERLSPAVRAVLHRFRRSVARTGYAEADLIAPLSTYHLSWALRHGARPSRIVPVPAGVDAIEHASIPENAGPAIVWAGNGGPDSGLDALLAAYRLVVAELPGTVLHLVGVMPAHENHCAGRVERSGLDRAVRLHPLPADQGDRYAAGHVIVHVPGPADPPHRLIEAMMSGRAVVAIDVGPAAETLGDAGVLVPPDDPEGLAAACVTLLRTPARRRALGDAARARALLYFTTDRVVRAYGGLYTDLAGPLPAPAHELALSVPAPRTLTSPFAPRREDLVKTLFPPYAHPSPELELDADTWMIRERPGDRRSLHQALGRIDLDWGSRSLADVLADVDAWREDGVEGLFLDRAPASAGGVGPVALVIRLAARRGLHRVVLNPGVPAHPLYRDLGVRICTFDGSWTAYQGWDGEGVRPGDGHIVHGVPTALLTAARRLMGRRGAGFGLATDASPYLTRAS